MKKFDTKQRLFENMKRLDKTFKPKLNETGEWDDEDEELIYWKDELRKELTTVVQKTNGKLKLLDVRGFDKYQGPYAIVEIDGRRYKVWTTDEKRLWIEDYPVDNTSSSTTKAGFEGNISDIIQMLNTGEAKKNSERDLAFGNMGTSLNETNE